MDVPTGFDAVKPWVPKLNIGKETLQETTKTKAIQASYDDDGRLFVFFGLTFAATPTAF
jgi:hypothetical protein